jgi:AcrR family transcriptional regulator
MPRLQAAERRAQLVEVARTVFARDGYRGATTLDVARAAGVSETLVLKHFGTKEGLFRAAVVDHVMELVERGTQPRRLHADARAEGVAAHHAKVRRFADAWCRLVRQERPQLVSLAAELREFPDVSVRLGELLRERVEELSRDLTVGTRRSRRYREVDVRVATYATLGAATIAALTEDDPGPFLDEFVTILFLGILSPEGRAELA